MKYRRWAILGEELKKNRTGAASLIMLGILTAASISAPLLPRDPNAVNVSMMKAPPSASHWFGTDEVGRDYFTRVLYGGRVSLMVGVLAMLTSVIIGTVVGTVSGYWEEYRTVF